jgi:hypothetical protein
LAIFDFDVTTVEKNMRFFLGTRLPNLLEPRHHSRRFHDDNNQQLSSMSSIEKGWNILMMVLPELVENSTRYLSVCHV